MVTWEHLEVRLHPYVNSEVMSQVLQKQEVGPAEANMIDLISWSGAVACLRFLVENPEFSTQIAAEAIEKAERERNSEWPTE